MISKSAFLAAICVSAQPEKFIENALQGLKESSVSAAPISQSIHSALQQFASHVAAVGNPIKFSDVSSVIEDFIETLKKPFTEEEYVGDCGIEFDSSRLLTIVPGTPDFTCRELCILVGAGCFCHDQGQQQIDTVEESCACALATPPPFGPAQTAVGTASDPNSPRGCVFNNPNPLVGYYNDIKKGPVGCDSVAPVADPEFVKACLCECSDLGI